MSDTDRDDSPIRGKSDIEAICPHNSQVDSTIDIIPPKNREIPQESDYECTPPDQYERYSSSQRFDVTKTALSVDQNAIRR